MTLLGGTKMAEYKQLLDSLEEGLQYGDQGGFPHVDERDPFQYSNRRYDFHNSHKPDLTDRLEDQLRVAGYIGDALKKGDYFSALHIIEGLDKTSGPDRLLLYTATAIYIARKLDNMEKGSMGYEMTEALVNYCVKNAGDLLRDYNGSNDYKES